MFTASGLATALRPIISTMSQYYGMYAYPVIVFKAHHFILVTSSGITTTMVWSAPVTSLVTFQATSVALCAPRAPVLTSSVTSVLFVV